MMLDDFMYIWRSQGNRGGKGADGTPLLLLRLLPIVMALQQQQRGGVIVYTVAVYGGL